MKVSSEGPVSTFQSDIWACDIRIINIYNRCATRTPPTDMEVSIWDTLQIYNSNIFVDSGTLFDIFTLIDEMPMINKLCYRICNSQQILIKMFTFSTGTIDMLFEREILLTLTT
jgi:hypothetical protein